MKTEPIDAMRERIKKLFEITAEDVTAIEANARRNEIIALAAFKKGQSSPKIKQLEWAEVNGLGETVIKAKTSFGDYDVYEKSDHDGYIIWCFGQKHHMFDTEIQAKMYAQADFERRVMKCLDL